MHQALKPMLPDAGSADVVPFPLPAGAGAKPFGRRGSPQPFSLVVDLASEELGLRWFRGAATLALLCGAALSLAPGLDPLKAATHQSEQAASGFQMNALLTAPAAAAAPALPPPTEQFASVPPEAAKPVVVETGDAIRYRGMISGGLYWSLRDAGVTPELAADYLRALGTKIDIGSEVAPFDKFDLIVAKRSGGAGPLLYAGLARAQGDDVSLMKWNSGGQSDWFDSAGGAEQRSDGLMAPVAGRITSRFGTRRHPILGFARMHSGVDFGAAWGSPIVASADGVIVGAGWSGGYGRQVRVAHESGIVTTYSHMSGIAAARGQQVRQGQVIGYVGSSGLSTGPHLHFEVRVGGQAVNPLSVRLQSRPAMDGREAAAFKARLKQLLSIGAKSA